jgi:PAS domain S-box-containing protein
MGWTIEKALLLGLGLVAALIAFDAGLGYYNIRQLDEDAGWVAHTHEVLDLTHGVLLALVDAETGQRGFLLTGKDEFLQPYDAARGRLGLRLAQLGEKTRDNPRQQERIDKLERMTAGLLTGLQEGIDRRRKGAVGEQLLPAAQAGKDQLDAIRDLVGDMEREERDLLGARERRSREAYRSAVASGFVTAALGLLVVGAFGELFRRSLRARQRAAEVAHEQREWFRTTLASIGDAVITTDAEGRVTFLNPVAQSLTGWAPGEADQSPLDAVFPIVNEQTRKPVENPVARVLREGTVVGLANHTLLLARDGAERPVDDSAAPIRDEAGKVAGVVLVFRDVSERRRLERLQRDLQGQLEQQVQERTAELRASEERFRLLVEGTRDYAIFILDPKGHVRSWNPGAERINGYRADEILGEHFSRFYPEEDVRRRKPDQELEVAAAEGRYEEEGWRVRKVGSRFWSSVLITALRDDAGNLRGFSKITRDITERKQAEENARRLLQEQAARSAAEASTAEARRAEQAERAQREQLRVTLESIGDALVVTDAQGRVTLLNPVAEALTGWARQDAAGQPLSKVFRIVNEKTGQAAESPVERVLREGAVVGLANHTVLIARDGTRRPIDDSAAPIRDEQGRVAGVVLVFRDISGRRRAEQTARFLADASASLATLVDYRSTLQTVARLAVPYFADWCAIDMVEPDGSLQRLAVAHVDPAKVELAHRVYQRYPPDPAAPHGPPHVIRTGRSELVPEITDAMIVAAGRDEGHLKLLRELGLKSYLCVPLAVQGKSLGAISFIAAESGRRYDERDLAVAEDLAHRAGISIENARLYGELRDALRQKEESLALLDTLQHDVPVGFAFIDRDFRYRRINEALADINGKPPREHLGRPVREVVPKLWPALEPLYRKVLESGEALTNQEVSGETAAASGQTRHWLANYYPVRVGGEMVGMGLLVVDITQRKRLEDELRQRAEQLQEQDRRKDEFLAMLAHELRNPLAPVRNALHVLKQPGVEPAVRERVREMMERQVSHMARLLDDLLDVSRISRGRIELRKEIVEVGPLVARTVEAVRPLIDERRHHLSVSLPPEPLRVEGDPTRLEQILTNLLNNAAKYTDPGGHLGVSASREGAEVVLRVRDDGIGIAPDVLPRVFDLFVQAERRINRSQGGVGIGLTLVRRLVELHGGRIEALSPGPGRGSEFVVRLPAATEPAGGREVATPSGNAAAPGSSPPRRVLVVDDNRDAADSLAVLLRLMGQDVCVAYDGPSALAQAQEFRPALVLLDIGMPGMDGYEVARRLRQQPELGNVVVAALTGWGQEGDRRRSAEAGFDRHLVKPVDPAALEALLAHDQESGVRGQESGVRSQESGKKDEGGR